MPVGYVLSERDYLTLKRDHYTLQRELSNLRSTVARGMVRKHQGGRIGPSQIRFRNDNSGTVPAFGVLRITGASTGANTTGGFLTIDKPDSTYRWLYLVNGEKTIPTGKFGFGSFLTAESINIDRQRVLYGSGTPAYGEEWGPTASAWTLQQYAPGFRILGGNDATLTTTVALQVIPDEIRVKNDTGSPIAAAGSGTVSLFGGSAGTTDLGYDIAVNNDTSISWASTKYGAAAMLAGRVQVSPQQT